MPSFLALDLVAEVAEKAARALNSLGLRGSLVFKPDYFTLQEIYEGHPTYKPYIYKLRPPHLERTLMPS